MYVYFRTNAAPQNAKLVPTRWWKHAHLRRPG